MQAERAKQGVFVLLWFKGKESGYEFNRPEKYESVEQLDKAINDINKDKNISIISINCSKPTAPSKLK